VTHPYILERILHKEVIVGTKICIFVGVSFNAHLMLVVLGYTNDLSEFLQRRDLAILTTINLVGLAKDEMQELRCDGWDVFLQKVTLF
jgi:hypothetical protein